MRNWKTVKRLVWTVVVGAMLSLTAVSMPLAVKPVSAQEQTANVRSGVQTHLQRQAVSRETKSARLADQIIALGVKFIGTPYRFGARSGQTRSFDCSSFTQYVYGKFGISLPRLANAQKQVGKTVSFGQLQRGDLMFFHTGYRSASKNRYRADHVAIYIGNQKILHATPKKGIHISKINRYWKKTFIVAKRVL